MSPRLPLSVLGLLLALGLNPPLRAVPVDINTADAATLVSSLEGIGRSKAEAIVAWRKAHGPFRTLDDLRQIKGIGPSILERNHDAIQFGKTRTGAAGTRRPARRPAGAGRETAPADSRNGRGPD